MLHLQHSGRYRGGVSFANKNVSGLQKYLIKGHRQRIFLLAIFVHVGYLNKDMYFIWNENYSIRSKKRMKLV